jgi:sortase B
MLGTLFIVAVFALTLPLTIPRLMGYQVFSVISGSMEPAIPVGSVIYVREADASEVQVDEIIAFYDEGSVVAHRVVANRTSLGEFVTKGDANNTEDLFPIPYDALIGVVALHVPYVGRAMAIYASDVGKVYLMLTLACGVMLNILADRLRRNRSRRLRRDIERQLADGAQVDASTVAAAEREERRASHGGRWVRTVVMAVLALVFLGSGGVVAFVNWQYHLSDETYDAAKSSYVKGTKDEAAAKAGVIAPIEIDFKDLLEVNPDIQGWIYCEGTDINYPVLQGETNDTYLRHDYRGDYNVRGSIFIDADNNPGFTDANTIVYGHHMSSGTMFAMLEDWSSQEYYDEHPYMWLLTPEQDYQIVLLSAHHVSAHSDLYEIYHEHDANFEHFVTEIMSESDFVPVEEATFNADRNYVMLTTCAYVFDDARYIIFGKLVPVQSAGGVALPKSKSLITN